MIRLARPLSALKPAYDAVVVGSGYGGGVAANRLARAGLRVAVLERGREIQPGEFPTRFPALRRDVQVHSARGRHGSADALFDVRLGPDMNVLVACGLGGGSLVNGGVALRPDARVFADPVWPDEVGADGLLDEGFAEASRWLRPNRHARGREMTKFRALAEAAGALGLTPVVPPLTISFEAATNRAGIAQPACTLCGDCCGGCNAGAKNTVLATYLADAARHGAELFTGAAVSHLARACEGHWRVILVPPEDTRDETRREISAAIVILAAGTLGSTHVLLKSREHGLTLSDRLGERFSANGDIIAFGFGAKNPVNAIGVGHPPRIEGLEVGAVSSGQIEIEASDFNESITIQEGAVPSALAPLLPVLFLPDGRMLAALSSLIKGVYNGPFAHLQTYFAVSHDSAGGRLALDDGRLVLRWPGACDEPIHARLDAALGALVAASGGNYVKNPLGAFGIGTQPATAHPLGGAGMGRDSADGVVNHKGQVFDAAAAGAAKAVHKGLYIVDGAVIPRSLGVNPLLTITALAERSLVYLARDWNLDQSTET